MKKRGAQWINEPLKVTHKNARRKTTKETIILHKQLQ